MDSDSDDDNVHFGTPLEPLEEGSAAKRRPPALEDQTVRDSRGRQRFHGAFTGGFSAGFFNTVGSKDGFQPASFVSSRSTRAERRPARPDDFMDDEDRGEHGIAPQRVQARDEFRPTPPGGVKRSRPQFDEGPIPGEPVLSQLVQPVRDTVGVRILKAMGWRPGQGIGPRITKKEKKRQKKVYGCALPPGAESAAAAPSDSDSDSDSDSALREVLLAPDDFEAPLVRPKHDHMGLGYRGLDRHSVLGAAAGDTTLRYRDKAGKVAIRGQAFGVGAFEDEDDDIYGTEDMSNYDFESAPEKPTSRPAPGSADRLARTLAGFRLSEGKRATRPRYPPPPLPPGFVPRHRARASRFEPRPEERRGLERHRLSAGRRAEMIGEQRPADPVGSSPAAAVRTETPTGVQSEAQPAAPVAAGLPGRPESERPCQPADSPAVKTEPGAMPADAERLREVHQLLAESGDSPAAAAPALKPFASDPEKQARYEKFLKLQAANRKEDYHLLLPASMTDWERQREVSEFHRSALIFRPLAASLADKFVSAGTSDQEKPPAPGEAAAGRKESTDPATQAARKRMFGFLTRQTQEWHPAALLCRRFNVKNPYPHSSIVGTLGLASGAASMSAPVLPTPTPVADAPAAPKPRLRWDDVLSDEEGGGTDKAAGGGDGATAPSGSLAGSLLALPAANTAGPPPATTAPAQKPPPDLFKAIFDDSDTESESEDAPAKEANSPGTPPLVGGAQTTAVTDNQLAASAGEGAAGPESSRSSPPVELQGQSGKPVGPSGRPTAASFFNQAPSAAAKRQGFSLFDNVDLDELNSWRRDRSGGGGNGNGENVAGDGGHGPEKGQTAAPAASVPAPPVGSLSPGSEDEYGPRLPPSAPTAATTSSSCLPVSCVGRKRKRSDSDADEWREMSPNGHKRKKSKKHKKSDKKKKKSKRRDSGSDSSDSDDVDRTLLKKLRDVVMKKKKKKKSSSRH